MKVNQLRQPVELYRMDTPEHSCPYGLLAVELLGEKGFNYTDHRLTTTQEIEAFKALHAVKTTPQIFQAGERIGGYSELAKFLGVRPRKPPKPSYRAVISVFITAGLAALALDIGAMGFMGISLVFLACLKLMDTAAFSTSFLKYNLLSQRVPIYGKVYPYLELGIGLDVLNTVSDQTGAGTGVSLIASVVGLIAIAVGVEGALSVYKAVYVEKRDLSCACLGGNSKTPWDLSAWRKILPCSPWESPWPYLLRSHCQWHRLGRASRTNR